MHRLLPTGAAAALLISLAACGGGDDATDGASSGDSEVRTVEIDMLDIAFEPATIEVDQGETVQFVFTNRGEVAHDAFIGGAAAQADHEAEMRDSDDNGHSGDHDDDTAGGVTVEPGETGELTYTFDEDGSLEIGCHQPGHYDAGMKIDVEVA